MNKKLVALAVAGAFALPLAAQAQTANVTLYGRINIDTEVIINAKQDGDRHRLRPRIRANRQGELLSRRLEQLTPGRPRHRVARRRHQRHLPDRRTLRRLEPSTVTNGGDSFVGLQGGWGTMKIGYFLTPYDDIGPIFGNVPTLITGIFGSSAVWSNTGWIGNNQAGGAFDDRVGNTVRYDTPNIGGFTASFQIAGMDVSGNADGGDLTQQRRHAVIYSMNALYNNGPFQAGIAYEAHNKTRASFQGETTNDQGFTVALRLHVRPGQARGWYTRHSNTTTAFRFRSAARSSTATLKRDMWGVSMIGNFGPGQMYAAWFGGNNGTWRRAA